jgi:molybdopterin biosynthesis enzyme
METLKYLAGYPQHLQARVRELIEQGRLGTMLADKYGQSHTVRNDGQLHVRRAIRHRAGTQLGHLAIAVVGEDQLAAVLDVQRVPTALVAVGDEHAAITGAIGKLDIDGERAPLDQQLRSVALERVRTPRDAHR